MGRYLIALGSNVRHARHGSPAGVLRAALAALDDAGITVEQAAPVVASAPLGPSRRRYANSVAVVTTGLAPPALLAALKAIERAFGRRQAGQRWASRVLDLDILLWSQGPWASPGLIVPHPRFRERSFVLAPALAVAAGWRDPLTGLSLRQLHHRLTRRLTSPRPLPRAAAVEGP